MPESNLLLRTQKNDIFNKIKSIGLNPSEFEWLVVQNSSTLYIPKLLHKTTGYYFFFDINDLTGHFWSEFSPGFHSGTETLVYDTREDQISLALEWLDLLKQEIEAPDLWAALEQEKSIVEIASVEDIENRNFSSEEQNIIVKKILELEDYLKKTQDFNEQQIEFVHRRLDYLIDAASRLTMKDWFVIFSGVILSALLQITNDTNSIQDILRFLGILFKPILGWVLPLSQ